MQIAASSRPRVPKRVANKKNNTQPASMISKTFLLVE